MLCGETSIIPSVREPMFSAPQFLSKYVKLHYMQDQCESFYADLSKVPRD